MSTETPFCTVENLLAQERNGSLFCTFDKYDQKSPSKILTVHRRTIILDWLLEVCRMLKLRKETWAHTVTLIDLCLGKVEISAKTIQLYGLGCLSLSAKKYEVFVPETKDYIYLIDNAYITDQLIEMEKKIAIALDFNIERPNIIEYIRLYSLHAKANLNQHMYTQILCRCYQFYTVKFLPSVIVAAAQSLASYLIEDTYVSAPSPSHLDSDGDGESSTSNIYSVPHDVIAHVRFKIAIRFAKCMKNLSNESGLRKAMIKDLALVGSTPLVSLDPTSTDFGEISPVSRMRETGSIESFEDKVRNFVKMTIGKTYLITKVPSCYTIKHYSINTPILKVIPPQKFTKIGSLGSGTYGTVSKIPFEDCEYAMKKMHDYMFDPDMGIAASFLREVSLLQNLIHDNIVRIHYVVDDCITFITELMETNLHTYITDKNNTSIITCHEFQEKCALDLLLGLEYIHSQGAIHRDVKPLNILMSGTWPDTLVLKYCDFGCSRGTGLVLDNYMLTSCVTTLRYRAPEILLGCTEYGLAIDIWSVACTINELCKGKALFDGDSEMTQIREIFRVVGTPTEETWSGVTSMDNFPMHDRHRLNILNTAKFNCSTKVETIIKSGLTLNPAKRPSAKNLLTIISVQ